MFLKFSGFAPWTAPRPRQCFVRSGTTLHRGHASAVERLTIAGGWSAESTPAELEAAWSSPKTEDVRRVWTHDPVQSEAANLE